MTRALTSQQLAQVTAGQAEPYWLVELGLSGGTRYLTDAPFDVTVSGTTYLSSAGIVQIGAPNEGTDPEQGSVTITLGAVDTTLVAAVLAEFWFGRPVLLKRVWWDKATGDVAAGTAPLTLFGGLMRDGWRVRERRTPTGPGTATLEGTFSTSVAGMLEPRGIQCSVASHQAVIPGDTFFAGVPTLAGQKILWAAPT